MVCIRRWELYHTLQVTNQQTLEDLSRLVTVSNVLESFSCVLPANIK
jgi:hypothetical protein